MERAAAKDSEFPGFAGAAAPFQMFNNRYSDVFIV